jgi:hypothetical protein
VRASRGGRAGETTSSAPIRNGPGRFRAALFALLLVAAAVVAGVVVHARTPKLELEVLHIRHRFSPNGDDHRDTAKIRFFVRDSDPGAIVQIVGPHRQRVRTLYRGPLTAHKPVTLEWNGRTLAGHLADPEDRYRFRVILPGQDRDMVYPRQIELVRTAGS